MPTHPGMIIELIIYVSLLSWGIRSIIDSFRRPKVRAFADGIITGKQTATEKQINECITWFLSRTNWLHGRTESDRCRVDRLRDMRNEMVTPASS